MINQRLFDQYKIDTKKNLNIQRTCAKPFDTLLIDKQGSCYACECTAWLPQSIGNLRLKTLEQILNSDMRQHLQESVSDSTYRYCNEHQCSYLKANNVPDKQDTHIKHLRLAFDESCNLRCPSCRTGLIFHKDGKEFDSRKSLADKVNTWLHTYEHNIQVHMGSDGDPFASNIYRYFMSNTPIKTNIGYSILTNGLMFEEHRGVLANIMGKLKVLGVSIDGASKQTYEKLRLGGRWDKIKSNLQSMADSKDKYNFWFRFHVVLQQDNWWEMKDMVELAESYGVDEIYFSKIQDWNTALDHSKQTFTNLKEFKDLCDEVNNMSTKYIVAGF